MAGQFNHGLLPSPPDNRDFLAEQLLGAPSAAAPESHTQLVSLVDIHNQGGTSTCFPAGTRVLLEDFSERPIEQVVEGNRVRTHTGKTGRVVATSRRPYNGKLYTLGVAGWCYPLTATAEHPIAIVSNVSDRAKHGKFECGPLVWKKAEEVQPGDRVLMPANTGLFDEETGPVSVELRTYVQKDPWEKDGRIRAYQARRGEEIPARLVLTAEAARLIGLFLAEGSYIKNCGDYQGLVFTFAREETNLHQFVQQALEAVFGATSEIIEDPNKSSVTRVLVYNSTLAQVFLTMCGEGSLWKRLDPVFFRSPLAVRLALLRGWYEGDGQHDPVTSRRVKDGTLRKGAQVVANTSSEELHVGLYRLASLCGVKVSARIRKQEVHQNAPGRELNLYGPSILAIFPDYERRLLEEGITPTDNIKYRRHDLGFVCRVESVSVTAPEDAIDVYNLEVEGDHTYVANGIAVHNCVWQAVAQAVTVFLKARNAPKAAWLSVLFGYWNTLKAQGRGITDKGCIPRIALQVLTDAGFCDEADWPFIQTAVLDQPLPDVYTAAFDQKLITSYYRLFGVQDELVASIKLALSQDRPVLWGSPIDAGYERYSGGVMDPPTGPWVGSHMRCLVGYTKDYAIEANSWGKNWGENGLARVSWEFITWAMAHDFWVFDGVPVVSG